MLETTNQGIVPIDGPGFVEGYEDEKEDYIVTEADRTSRVPSHPGLVLRELYLPRTGVSQTALADCIGVSRRTVNMILNGQRPITVDMAQRLSRAFGTTARLWINLQRDYDLWEAQANHAQEYEKIALLAA